MTKIALKGNPVHTTATVPAIHSKAPDFHLVDKSLKEHSLKEFAGKRKLLATVPSLDTSTCSIMAKRLNDFAKEHPKAVVLVVSADLPFAQKRFCDEGHVENVITLSMMRNKDFGKAYGVLLVDGPIAGLLARSLFVIDEHNQVLHAELVAEVSQEPDYNAAFTYFG